MREDRNQFQIIRKDARNCFVESLNDSFSIGRIHLAFAAYDQSKPAGQRQTNNVHIYIAVDEFLELCRKLDCGELRYMLQSKKKNGDNTPLYQCLGGTSAEKLIAIGRARSDGRSLSRVAQLVPANKADFLFVADSGPGETNEKGLIVPKFGNRPENHVAVMMSFESLSEMFLITRMEKVEDDFMEMAPTDPKDVVRFVKEVPYWTAKKHGKKYRLMYQIYTHPKYIEHGKKFFEGVNERYTEYAKRLEPKIGIPYTIITPLIFIFVRASVHYAMFEDEYYLQTQMEVLKQGVALFADKYRSQYLNGGNAT